MCRKTKNIYIQSVITLCNAFFVYHDLFIYVYTNKQIATNNMVLVTLKTYLQKPLKMLHKMVT